MKRYLDFLVKRQKLGTANIGWNNIVYSLLEYPDGDSNGDSNTPAMGTAMGTILNKDKKEKKDKSFQKPTPEEVEQYCKERSNNIDPIRFVNFYESKGRKVGNQSMKDWKACIRTREQKNKPPEPQTQEDYIKAFKEIWLVQFRKRYWQDKANEIMQVAI